MQEKFTYWSTRRHAMNEDGSYVRKTYRTDPYKRKDGKNVYVTDGMPFEVDGSLLRLIGFVPSRVEVHFVP